MFLTYLRRELRRRMRQAIIVAVGLAIGIGLVIVVTSVSSGVKNAQASVLHALYGEGTDITVTKTPTAGSGGGAFGFRGSTGTGTRPAAGTTIDIDTLRGAGLGAISSSSVTTVSKLNGVAAAAGGLTLTDTKITGKIPAINTSGGSTGGFGEKNRVHNRITPIDNSDAASSRNSWPNLGFLSNSLTCGPHDWRPPSGKYPALALQILPDDPQPATLPAPGRIQTSAKVAGNARAASTSARPRAPAQIARQLHRNIANR